MVQVWLSADGGAASGEGGDSGAADDPSTVEEKSTFCNRREQNFDEILNFQTTILMLC